MDNRQIDTLLDKLSSGDFTQEEEQRVKLFIHLYSAKGETSLTDEDFEEAAVDMWKNIEKASYPKVNKIFNWRLIAASIFVVIGSSMLYFYSRNEETNSSDIAVDFKVDIPSAKNGATLTLSSGKKIYIDDETKGTLTTGDGLSIFRAANGDIIYKVTPGSSGALGWNTLQTRNGEHTQLILPDNSKVYLNAGTLIKYPASFGKLKERRVELSGEAYFEVFKDKQHPFIVSTINQEIQVLGTHFNVNSYSDKVSTKTTLLEGSVLINKEKALIPGQFALTNNSGTQILPADTELEIAWKNNDFYFKNQSMESVMRQVARWYDISVTYSDESLKSVPISGLVSRSKPISVILDRLGAAGHMHFKIEGKKISVTTENHK